MVYGLLDFKHGMDFIDFGFLGLGEFANRQYVGTLHGEFKKILNIYTTLVYINTETCSSTSKITHFFQEKLNVGQCWDFLGGDIVDVYNIY